VTLVNRSQITRIYSYRSGVLGRWTSKSLASAAKGSVAVNNLMSSVLCVPMTRFCAQVRQAATHPNTSIASEGPQYWSGSVWHLRVPPGCAAKGKECSTRNTPLTRDWKTSTCWVPSRCPRRNNNPSAFSLKRVGVGVSSNFLTS